MSDPLHLNGSYSENTEILSSGNTLSGATVVKSNKKKPLLIAIIFITFMFISGIAAATYNSLVINSPERIWNQALQKTSDTYTQLSEKIQSTQKKGGNLEGDFMLTAPIAATGSINGQWYEKNAKISGDVNFSGIETSAEIRVIVEADSGETDAYVRFDGLDNAAPLFSLVQPELVDVVTAINGNWYKIDGSPLTEDSELSEDTAFNISAEKLAGISSELSSVLNDRLFTADESKAVIVVKEAIGREEFAGKDSYKFKVRVQKQQFTDFMKAFTDTLEGTQLQDEGLESITGVIEQINQINFDQLQAEAWVDMEYKHFRTIRIPVNDVDSAITGYIDFGLDYRGGDEIPLSVRIVTTTKNNDTNDEMDALFEVSLNKTTTELDLGFTIGSLIDGQKFDVSSNLLLKPSEEMIEIQVPENTLNISDLLGLFMNQSSSQLPFSDFTNTDNTFFMLDDIEL